MSLFFWKKEGKKLLEKIKSFLCFALRQSPGQQAQIISHTNTEDAIYVRAYITSINHR